MRYNNCNVLSHISSASANGIQIDANQLISASFHAICGKSDVAGTFKVQASNDMSLGQPAADFVVTNWVDIPNATATVSSGASALITINQVSYRWMRVVFTTGSGGDTGLNKVNMMALSV